MGLIFSIDSFFTNLVSLHFLGPKTFLIKELRLDLIPEIRNIILKSTGNYCMVSKLSSEKF